MKIYCYEIREKTICSALYQSAAKKHRIIVITQTKMCCALS
ncbi:MAG: hypothetical protein JETT_3045 [Candidatus Jettenia ecosi]|uniref:Uncharacterized protein n=1 Tax=Candidatus Jettenia ecosi TaxID=2494326 RepID=A0A533Q7R5_9BACT|nr:MAG: hypothetical protein JETT_3045 [Candidatus Jettenia ecosi]